MTATALDVVEFWWQAGADKWFRGGAAFDDDIRARFGDLHARTAAGAHADWEHTVEGALALILVLDQFSRNLFRNDARAFAWDAQGLGVADRAIVRGFDRAFPVPHRRFFFLPFEHSESMANQDRSVALHEACGDTDGLPYARAHRDVIARFGRFPHRNAVLGRATTKDEQAWLDAGGGW